MSQKKNVSATFGSLTLSKATQLRTGSLSSVNIVTTPTPVTLTTTATTVTAAQVLSGLVVQTPASALTVTLPAAAVFVSAVTGSQVGDTFRFTFVNASSANAGTVAVDSTTGTLVGSGTVATSSSATFVFRLTTVGSSPTYTVYRA